MTLTPDDLEAAAAVAKLLRPLSTETRDQLALLLRPAVAAVRQARQARTAERRAAARHTV